MEIKDVCSEIEITAIQREERAFYIPWRETMAPGRMAYKPLGRGKGFLSV